MQGRGILHTPGVAGKVVDLRMILEAGHFGSRHVGRVKGGHWYRTQAVEATGSWLGHERGH